jgi:hypothetical protein
VRELFCFNKKEMALIQPDSGLLIWIFVSAALLLGLGAFIGIVIYRSFRRKKY